MAQADYVVANGTGAAVRSDLNGQLAAIVSNNSGVTEPATMYAYQWWADTTTGLLKLRNAANNAWITIGTLADVNLGLLSLAGGTLTGALLLDDSGTVSAPALAFDGDTNTGIFRSAADTLNVATNGIERAEFGTSEVVFNDGGADVDFRVEGDTNASLFFVDASAEAVGIGTTSPGAPLDIPERLRIRGSTSGYSQIDAPAIAGDQTFTLPTTGGTLDRLNRAGNILQVVNATYSTETSNSTTTYADTGLTASITPTSSSSKVLVLISQNGLHKTPVSADNGVSIKLFRGVTELALSYANGYTGTTVINYPGGVSFCYLDSPATTSSTTYKTQFANIVPSAAVFVQSTSSTSHITLLEVAA